MTSITRRFFSQEDRVLKGASYQSRKGLFGASHRMGCDAKMGRGASMGAS